MKLTQPRPSYTCQSCGHHAPKWLGRCPECDGWGTMVEEAARPVSEPRKHLPGPPATAKPLADLPEAGARRIEIGISELDRVLGGGLVPGSVVLVGGDPGIGKSTLLLQAAESLARRGTRSLYVTGEESEAQIRLRAERVGAGSPNLLVLAETSVEKIEDCLGAIGAGVIVVDSIQTIHSLDLSSGPGTVGQVRETASRFLDHAKRTATPVVLIGHVTKDGALAGPKVLEHMVDVVLAFEGERGYPFRILRGTKNRYGSTNEVGVFEMAEAGLSPVENPSMLFLAERPAGVSGSAVVPTIEGTRPLLVEIQALVSSPGFATPRRSVIGVDPARAALLAAVLEKKVGIGLADRDIYVSVAGGLTVTEPAADLGIAAALASSARDRAIPAEIGIFGEVGLAGEVRACSRADARIAEAAKLGFRRLVLPEGNLRSLKGRSLPDGVETIGVTSLAQALEITL